MKLLYLIITLSMLDVYAGSRFGKCLPVGSAEALSESPDYQEIGDDDSASEDNGYLADDESCEEDNTIRNWLLLECVRKNDTHGAQLLLKGHADVNVVNSVGQSALCLASFRKDCNMIAVLLMYRANPNHRGFEGKTPLHYAAMGKGVDSVPVLLSLIAANGRPSINAIDDLRHRPLEAADSSMAIKALLLCGADYNKKRHGWLRSLQHETHFSCSREIPISVEFGLGTPENLACAETLVAMGAIGQWERDSLTAAIMSQLFRSCEQSLSEDDWDDPLLYANLCSIHEQSMQVKEIAAEQDWYAQGDAELFVRYMSQDNVYLVIQKFIPDCCTIQHLVRLTPAFITEYTQLPENIALFISSYVCQSYELDHQVTDPNVRSCIPWLIMQKIQENRCKNMSIAA